MLTRKEAVNMCSVVFHTPYCDEALKLHAVKIGSNHGLYGCNWTLYKVQGNDAGIISGCRSLPAGCVYLSKNQIDELRNCESPENLCKLVYKWVQEYRGAQVKKELERKKVAK